MPILNRPLRVMHIISGDLWAGAEVQAYTLLKHLQMQVELKVVLLNEGELANNLRKIHIPVEVIPEARFSSFKILLEVARVIKAFVPDVIHTHRQKENILGNIAKLFAQSQLLYSPLSLRTTHGAPEFTPRFKQKIQIAIDNWVGRYIQHAIISVSEDLAQKLYKIFPKQKVHVIHNGVDITELQANNLRANFGINQPNCKHIGIIGRLEPVKRIDLFIGAAHELLRLCDFPLKFHIIGDGKLRDQLSDTTRKLGIADNVIFHGHRTDIPACIKALDLVVMSSDHEGTPMIALETLALGTLLVAHDVGGLSEILENEQHLLVQDHSAIGYARKIKMALELSSPKITLASSYTATENAQQTLHLYEKLQQQK